MDPVVRRKIFFSRHASLSLFECLIVAGAPATGLLQDEVFVRQSSVIQKSLELLRDMWRRVDTLYVYPADVESLRQMECESAGFAHSPIPKCISAESSKMARYYVYLLFRYCVSFTAAERDRFVPKMLCMWDATHVREPCLQDIPDAWISTQETPVPSAPPGCEDEDVKIPLCYQQPTPMDQLYPQNGRPRCVPGRNAPCYITQDEERYGDADDREPTRKHRQKEVYPGLHESRETSRYAAQDERAVTRAHRQKEVRPGIREDHRGQQPASRNSRKESRGVDINARLYDHMESDLEYTKEADCPIPIPF